MKLENRLEQIHRPKEVLDLKGLLMHSYHGAKDPNSFLGSDGTTLIKRAGHGLEAFWERYLQPIFERTAPIDVVAVLDRSNEVRSSIYPLYKAKRKAEKEKEDPRLTEQMQMLQKEAERLLMYLGCTVMEVPKLEADDVIAMICHKYPGPVVVHTRDLDLAQLAVLPNVTVMLMEKMIDPEEPIQLGNADGNILLPARHITLYKSLCGDKSDEYPGVSGIGPKAWTYLVNTYQDEGLAEIEKAVMDNNPDAILEAANEYGDKVLLKMHTQFEQWRMCYRLATLHPAWCWMARGGTLLAPIYHKRLPLAVKVREVLDRSGIGALYEDLKQWCSTETLVDGKFITPERIARIKSSIEDSPAIGFDTEGYDKLQHQAFKEANGGKEFVDTLSQTLTGGSLTFGRNLQHTIYIPTLHRDTANVDKSVLADLLAHSREKAGKLLIAHNARFEQGIIERDCGMDLPDMEDTMTWLSYYNESMMEGANGGGNLKEMSLQLLRHSQVTYSEVLAASGATDMRGVSGEEVLHYGCDDALTAAHAWVMMTFAVSLEGQSQFIQEFDVLTGKALNRAFFEGINIDFDEAARQQAEDKVKVQSGMARVRELLTLHCIGIDAEVAEQRARLLLEADREYLEMKIRGKNDGIGSEKLKSELQTKLFKYLEAVAYRPYSEHQRTAEFTPTKLQILQVARHLGLPEGAEHEMDSTSGKKMVDWLLHLNQLVYESDVVFEPEIEEFLRLLGGASSQINKRAGEEYEVFAKFCLAIAQRHAPTFWEGDELNFDSPPQMTELLYLKLGLPVRVRSKVQRGSDRDKWRLPGSPATNEKAMTMAIAEDAPEGDWRREFLRLVLEVKGALTREELFWRPYPLWKRPDTGMVHGSIKNNGTVTRRPTGSKPNLLQVSKGPVRRIVIPRYRGQVIVSIDFSGQELRITGSEAKDPAFIDAYLSLGTYVDEYGMVRQNVKDVHSVTGCMFAMEVLRRELDQAQIDHLERDEFGRMNYPQFRAIISDGVLALSQLDLDPNDASQIVKAVNKVRKMAKSVNFLICYLGQASTLASNIGIPKAFAEQIMTAVFAAYARLAPWQAESIQLARKQGFVTTAYGNWKHVSADILSKDGGKRSRAERQAVNQMIQGCAADILKVVLTRAEKQGIFSDPRKAVMHAPIYDEILSSVSMDYCFEYVEKMQDIMNLTPPGHAIPMMGEVSIGLNWCDQEELGDRPAERKIINLFESWVKSEAV